MKPMVIEMGNGRLIYDMRRAQAKWPRRDGGRWMVRCGEVDRYRKSFLGAVLLAWRSK